VRRLIPPTPVIVVVVLFTLVAVAALAIAVGGFILGGAGAIGFALVALLMTFVFGLTAYSLWQARRGARVTSIILGAVLIMIGLPMVGRGDLGGLAIVVSGIAVIALVAAPQSAREWFAVNRP
jgi:lysylphosphatidylglycerol synthetase-like protein (DUF2156 family)